MIEPGVLTRRCRSNYNGALRQKNLDIIAIMPSTRDACAKANAKHNTEVKHDMFVSGVDR